MATRDEYGKLVNDFFVKRIGYGFLVGEILSKKGVRMRKSKPIGHWHIHRALDANEGSATANSINTSTLLIHIVRKRIYQTLQRAKIPIAPRKETHDEKVTSAQMQATITSLSINMDIPFEAERLLCSHECNQTAPNSPCLQT
nr:hypothetical protein Iba_chr04bCG15340 [Ipomoea batatas]